MVAEGDHIDAGGEELVADFLGDAEAVGRVLAIGDDEIGRQVGADFVQPVQKRGAPGAPHHVAEIEKFHLLA